MTATRFRRRGVALFAMRRMTAAMMGLLAVAAATATAATTAIFAPTALAQSTASAADATRPMPPPAPLPPSMRFALDTRIPMRDGVTLSARIWRPGAAGRYPVVMQHTPYLSDEAQARARKFVAAGYAYVSIDRRGRGTSEGRFVPLEGTGADGADAIAWLAAQDWSDGRVATMGGSYRGTTQWQTLAYAPPALKAAVPTASVYPGWDYPAQRGIPYGGIAQWLAFTSGRASNLQLYGDEGYWREQQLRVHRGEATFARLAEISGAPQDAFATWLARPNSAWRAVNPSPAQYAAMTPPILTITGYFDGDQDGALRYYEEHRRHAPPAARDAHLLLIGPWDHAGTLYPSKEVGGLRFDDAALLDLDALHIAWFDHLLRGKPRPAALAGRVNYYVMGAETWRSAERIEAIADATWSLYLRADGAPGPRLDPRPGPRQPASQYVYDPRLDRHGADWAARGLPQDRLTRIDDDSGRPRLRFDSAPIDAPRTVCGRIRLDASIAIDTPDTDILAEVHAIDREGRVAKLGEDKIRARFRLGEDRETLAQPGRIERWRFDRFWWSCRRLTAGTRLRLTIGPLDDPYFQKNFNSGGRIGHERIEDAHTATVRIHHDREFPSVLHLPIASER